MSCSRKHNDGFCLIDTFASRGIYLWYISYLRGGFMITNCPHFLALEKVLYRSPSAVRSFYGWARSRGIPRTGRLIWIIVLDTNICIYLINKRPLSVLVRFTNFQAEELGISVIIFAELQCGIEKSSVQERNQNILDEFISRLTILDWERSVAQEYAVLKANLQKKGAMIGPSDWQIAAHVKSRGDALVTNNLREFNRVPDLKLENWV